MAHLGGHRKAPRRRLARRLFALFLLTSLLPLALSGWVSGSAVNQIAEALSLGERASTTRQTAMQVFDRLMAGKTLAMVARARQAPDTGAPAGAPVAPGIGRVFLDWQSTRSNTPGPPQAGADVALLRAWIDAAPPSGQNGHGPRPDNPDRVGMQLRIASAGKARPRVLLGVSRSGVLMSVAEFDPAYLWAPLANAGEDSGWSVLAPGGQTLTQVSGGDYRGDSTGTEFFETRFRLFLDGEFDADDWSFVQRSPRPQVLWHGQRLAIWLGLVALGTLLTIALLGRWLIQRTLVPLAQLTEGTRRLAAGERETRVEVHSEDEISALAGAFNDMAARIEAQFDAIQGLAAIDGDILAGLPVSGLAERVLRQLAAIYPRARATVFWRDGEFTLHRLGLEAGTTGGDAIVVRTDLMQQAPLQAFAALADDRITTWTGSLEPDDGADALFATRSATLAQRVLLPLRLHDRTQALLALEAPAPPLDVGRLQAARDLRDRLAVGLATRAREQELMHRAVHDSLTGLTNRAGFGAGLDEMLAGAGRDEHIAVLFLDLDHFKDVNDTRGHEVGDALLCLAGRRLVSSGGPDALVARQGGDEFAVVLRRSDEADALRVATCAIEAMREPFLIGDTECLLGASVGIAFYPEHGRNRDQLLRCADVALYAAKAAGRDRASVFTMSMDAAVNDRAVLLSDMHRALQRKEFLMHYQPRVQPEDGEIASAEALMRWQHPTRGLLFPDTFIALAEASGLIESIGMWVVDTACAQMAAWRREGLRMERVSVNVSPRQLGSGNLPGFVRAALDRHALAADALELEVTESLLVGDLRHARVQLETLRGWGISIALDDFGTGYSSMSTLRQLPIDVMKIDRSFVKELGIDDGAMAVIRTIVTLARSLDMQLVAEGVETTAQAALLGAMGCDELQGYLYSRPVAPDQFAHLAGLKRALPTVLQP